jgi:predicted nucleic acid-binding protein
VIAVDTNVVVRLLVRDDETQYQASRALFETQEIFIPDTVVLELEWVLRYAYDFSPAEIGAAFATVQLATRASSEFGLQYSPQIWRKNPCPRMPWSVPGSTPTSRKRRPWCWRRWA